jgi:VWFA-related protein
VAENSEGRIKLDVVVTDKPGKPVSGLEMKDFTLTDDKQTGKILSFHVVDGTVQPADPPVEVILVIDTVNMPYLEVTIARQEIAKFLLQNGGHLAQPVSIQVFTNQGLDIQSEPSTDGNALAVQVNQLDNRLRTLGRSAAGNGATERFKLSIQAMGSIAGNEAKKPGKKLLIWAGEGWPMLDVPNFQVTSRSQQQYFNAIVSMSTLLREARISVYSISQSGYGLDSFRYEGFLKGVKTTNDASPPYLALKVLAIESGGRVLGPDNNLAGQINTCVQDASTFYTLSFDPPRANKPNEHHDLKVQIDKPGLKAHTSTGYYNQP